MHDLSAALIEKMVAQAPELVVLLLLLIRIDRRMQTCFVAMHEAMERLLDAVIDDETSHSR